MTIADLNAECRDFVDADTTSYPAATLLRRINTAYEEVVAFILGCDGKWQFDDTNYTDFPIGITTMVAGQADYSFNSTHLEIERVSVKDTDGNWQELTPIDQSEIVGDPEEYSPDAGMPLEYDKQGGSIVLYPAPSSTSVTLTNGLKIYFKRTADLYTSAEVTTGTKEPGFASPFHIILAYKAAIPFAMKYIPSRVPALMTKVKEIEKEMVKHYSRRELDRKKVMGMRGISHR